MGMKDAFYCKRFVTNWTAERFLPCVQSHMTLKGACLWKRFLTNWTAVRFLPRVHSHMNLKVTQTREIFDTIWTTVPPISSCILTSPENNDLGLVLKWFEILKWINYLIGFDLKPLCAKWLFPTCYLPCCLQGIISFIWSRVAW